MLQALTNPSPLVPSIISAMITPAILILATGNLIATSMILHARIVDRTRYLIRRRIELHASDAGQAAVATALIGRSQHRLTLIGRSLSVFYLAIGFFVVASLAIAVTSEFAWLPRSVPTIVTVVGAALLLLGALMTFYDTRLATNVTLTEIDEDFV